MTKPELDAFLTSLPSELLAAYEHAARFATGKDTPADVDQLAVDVLACFEHFAEMKTAVASEPPAERAERCELCKFWAEVGFCHRGLIGDGQEWPERDATDWCGEFQSRLPLTVVKPMPTMAIFCQTLSARTVNTIRKYDDQGLDTVAEIITFTETDWLAQRNFGNHSLCELRNRLAMFGLALRGE